MVVVRFPGPERRAPDGFEQPSEPRTEAHGDPGEQLRDLLLQTHLRRVLRARRRPKSPVSVIAHALDPQRAVRGVGATGMDPVAMLGDWLGMAMPGEVPAGLAALFELQRAQLRPAGQPSQPQPSPSPPATPPAATRDDGAAGPFWPVWMEHFGRMRSLALRLMKGNEADAEDALSAAMIRAERAFDPASIQNPAAWFSRLVRNACIDHYRHRQRAPVVADPFETQEQGADDGPAPHRARSGEDELLASEGLRETLCAILELPEELMEPLMLRCLAERSYDEIAEDMGLSNAAVRKRVQLARRYLQDLL